MKVDGAHRCVIKTFSGFCTQSVLLDNPRYEIYLETKVGPNGGVLLASPTVTNLLKGASNSFNQTIETYADPGTTVSFYAIMLVPLQARALICHAYLSGLAAAP